MCYGGGIGVGYNVCGEFVGVWYFFWDFVILCVLFVRFSVFGRVLSVGFGVVRGFSCGVSLGFSLVLRFWFGLGEGWWYRFFCFSEFVWGF